MEYVKLVPVEDETKLAAWLPTVTAGVAPSGSDEVKDSVTWVPFPAKAGTDAMFVKVGGVRSIVSGVAVEVPEFPARSVPWTVTRGEPSPVLLPVWTVKV